jgi:glutamine synthetase
MAASNIPTELREASMAGNLDLKELEDLIRKEDVDTVLTVFPYFYAPTVNSYKRYQAASFAPTRLVAGWDNRTCGFRLCGDEEGLRVENRIPGADANPYLAFAATIAAGLYGIHHQLKPPQLYEGNAYTDASLPQVPRTLREAIAALETSEAAREAFSERVLDHYLQMARLEQEAFDRAVTDWELMRNFERI